MDEVQPVPGSAGVEQDRSTALPASSSPPSRPVPTTRRQGIIIIVLLFATLVVGVVLAYIAAKNQFTSPKYEQKTIALLRQQLASPKYEYKTIAFYGSGPSRTGLAAFKFTTITPKAAKLNALGAQGWEVVGTYLEMETAWPNFGSAKYVTGLQANVRPQRLVLVLQRRLPVSN